MVNIRGPWTRAQLDQFLRESAIPLRLACNGSSGHPILGSFWFRPHEGRLWCATQRNARIVSRLTSDPRCAFEVASEVLPYRGVRGQGVATLRDDLGEATLRALLPRYLDDPDSEFARWLLSRAKNETAIAIEPRSVLTWDFAARMTAGAST